MSDFSAKKIGFRFVERLALPQFRRGAKLAPTLAVVSISWLLRLMVVGASLLGTGAYATVTITSATGGTNILADKAANAISPAWTALGPIVIREGNRSDFSSGANLTLFLKAPGGFEFDTSVPLPNITFTSGVDISAASVAVSNSTTITVTLTVGGTSGIDQLTIGNTNAIRVRPTAGTPLATGQIFRPQTGGGSAVINGITTSANADGSGGSNFGSLSEVVGAAIKLAFTRDPGGATTGAPFGAQPIVKAQDQFGNNSSTGLAASNIVSLALASGTGPLLGTTNLNVGTGAGNGTVTYTNLEIDAGGTNKQLTASASGLASALSAVFTVNSPPTISNIPNLTTNEDKVATTSFTISDLETPADSLVLSATSSNTNLIPNGNIVFGGAGNNRTLAITPVTSAFGTSTINVSVSDGTLSSSDSFLLTINPVNDAPTMNALANLTILEDTNTQTVNLTGISPGPSNESTQTVTITASSSNPSLIPNPTVNYSSPNATGTLTFAPLTNQFGTATITVILTDNGGTANGGIDSLTNSFLVTVISVNDAPTLDPLSDVSLGVNPGLQTIALTGISPGPANESTQTVTITASSSNPGLIPNPTVSYSNPNSSGSLSFTPVSNASGTAIITVTNRDNGGTANGGQDTTTRQFAVTVSPLSDLSISQVAIPNPGFVGGTINFKLTVTNAGPTTATAIQVTNTLPAGIGSVSVTSSQGSSTNYGAVVVCSLGNLTNGGAATINVIVEPLTPGSYTNSASVWSSVADPKLTNNGSSTVAAVVAGQFVVSGTALVSESCTNGGIDPAEIVTVSFSVQNTGSSDTTNLVATLKATGGVTQPSGPQTYGVLTAGGPAVSRSFTFTPLGSCGGTFTAVLQLQDGASSLGTASKTLTFGQLANRTTSVSNSTFIAVPSTGAAALYPSMINVFGLNPNLLKATVSLNGISHSQPHDLEILLVGPAGQKTWLMSDCGGINTVNNITLTFDNAAASGLPNQNQIFAGTFKPSDFPPDDVLPASAPTGPYVADLSVFNGTDPNGAWQLYVFDDTSGFSGNIARGWTLNLTTLEPTCCIDSHSIDVTFAGISAAPNPVVVGNNLTFTIVATNQGPATATGVSITNPIPPTTTFVSASSSQGSCSVIGGAVVCSLGSLTNTGSAALSVTFQTTQPGILTNSASISANEPDHALSNSVGAGTVTVSVPAITIGDATVLEGNSGTTTNAVFTLQLSAVSSQTISVNYATTDITTTANSDYVATNGTVVFTPGQTTKTVVVTVIGDNLSEATEFFGVALSNPTNVTFGNVQGTGTIVDDDPLPTLSISDASVIEGNSGTTNMLFTVTVSPVSGQMVSCNFSTANGSALAGSDYVTSSGTLTINAGQPSQTIAVPVIGDTLNESNETFFVNVSGVVNANLGRSQAVGTIINDDFFATIAPAGTTLASENCSPANGVIDPNEMVTVNFALHNVSAGSASTTNLTATLLQMGGITLPGAAQTYGALAPAGASVSRPFSFTANGICGDSLMAVLQLQDGGNSLGLVTNFIAMGKPTSVTNSFSNLTALTIPESGPASTYPSPINVTGLSGNATRVTATLFGLSHASPSDLEILLVGPGGQTVLLMSDAGDSMAISNVTLTFDDNAAPVLPNSAQIFSGSYKPTDYPPNDPIPSPAPPGPYGTNLSIFNGTNPNGTWNLYVDDDSFLDSGSLSGWSLNITSPGGSVCCGSNSMADLTVGLASSVAVVGIGSNITYTINVTNFGPQTASDVVLADTLPAIVNFVSASSSIGTPTYLNGIVTCNLNTMTNGGRASIIILVTTTVDGSATNSVMLSSRAADPNPANNSASTVTTVLPPPHLAINPASLDFGPVVIGRTNTLNFQVLNTGGLTLTGSAATFDSFAVRSGSPFTVAGYGSNTVAVSFAPTTVGSFSNVVVFTSNGGNTTNTVIASGITPARLSVSPPSFNFGIVTVGSNVQTSFVAANLGQEPLTGGVASLNGGPFTILSGTPFSLAGSGSTNIVVSFAPTDAAPYSNVVVFTTSTAGSSTNAVIGSGAFVPLASFRAQPTTGFWPLTVSFTDSSSGTITNRFWDFGDGSTTNTSATNLTHSYAGPSTNTVRLTATGPVGISTVVSNGYIVVTNLPPKLAVSPTNLDFGPVVIGQSRTQVFAAFNAGQLVLNGSVTAASPFSVVGGTPFSVGMSQTGLVQVVFTPTQAGSFNVAALFSSNGGNSTNALSGIGLAPAQLAVSPAAFDFGTIAVGASAQTSFVATNLGDVTLSNVVVTVDSVFSIAAGNSFNLSGHTSTNVVIQFAPVANGVFSNNVVFLTSNAGSSTNTVTGTGATIPLASFQANPTSGFWPVTVNFTDSSTGTITNRFWDFGDGMTTNTTSTILAHIYSGPGTNTVRLTVNGPVGISTVVSNGYIVVTNLPPKLVVGPSSLDFGPVIVGQSRTQFFSVFNSGQLVLNGSVTAAAPFSVVSGSPFSLNMSQTGLVQVAFTPTQAGSFNGSAFFSSNDGGSTDALSGIGLAPAHLAVSPAGIDFGTLVVGTSAQASFAVTNVGNVTASNAVVSVDSAFSVVSGNAFDLPGHSSTNVVIQFAPAAEGFFSNNVVFLTANDGSSTNPVTGAGARIPQASFQANPTNGFWPLTVSFTDSSAGTITNRFWDFGDGAATNTTAVSLTHSYSGPSTNTVTLTATGPLGADTRTISDYVIVTNLPARMVVTPTNLDFGPVVVGQTSTQLFQVVNAGQLVLTASVSAVTAPFEINVDSPFSINGGQTNQVMVIFSPTAEGSFSDAAIFTSNDGSSTNSLTGSSAIVPVAGFNAIPVSGHWPLTVSFSSTSTGTITNLFWDFGDGSTTNTGLANPIHIYTAAHTNTVTLTASGPAGTDTLTVPAYIVVSNLPPRILVSPANADFGVHLVGTTSQAAFAVTNLGDLTANNAVVTIGSGPFSVVAGSTFNLPGHGYTNVLIQFAPSAEGTFSNNVVFSTANAGTLTNTVTGTGVIVITASFVGSPTAGTAPLTVNFVDSSTGTITNRSWDFGDNTTTNAAITNVAHTYLVGGAYTVRLTVRGAAGSNTLTRAGYVSASNVAPAADFTGSPVNGSAPLAVTFTDTSTGTVTNRLWDFGDGSTSNTPAIQVIHPYAAGTYRVKLTATGPVGSNSRQRNNYISVTNAPARLLVTPANQNFGTVTIGHTNTLAFQAINLGSFSLTGAVAVPSGSTFKLASASSFTLLGGQTNAVLVAFSPPGTNTYTTNVVFTSNAGNSTNAVSGTGALGSPLVITAIQVSGADVSISFSSSPGLSYALDFTDTLSPAAWNTLNGSIPGTGNIVTARDSGGANRSLRFYRIRQLP